KGVEGAGDRQAQGSHHSVGEVGDRSAGRARPPRPMGGVPKQPQKPERMECQLILVITSGGGWGACWGLECVPSYCYRDGM
ncbi:hypothetical protein, partial [Gelidibacter salicanalis]|uniref:hypothetical protein n=1 Tax=Gelidibacter salicanalis TaxID=291193 RepID=UPI001F2A66DA